MKTTSKPVEAPAEPRVTVKVWLASWGIKNCNGPQRTIYVSRAASAEKDKATGITTVLKSEGDPRLPARSRKVP